MPSSEFEGHWSFWKQFRWGMQDDLQAIAVTNQIRAAAPKTSIQPWMVKEWTVQANYTHRIQQVVRKPVSAIRSGFLAIAKAIEGLKR